MSASSIRVILESYSQLRNVSFSSILQILYKWDLQVSLFGLTKLVSHVTSLCVFLCASKIFLSSSVSRAHSHLFHVLFLSLKPVASGNFLKIILTFVQFSSPSLFQFKECHDYIELTYMQDNLQLALCLLLNCSPEKCESSMYFFGIHFTGQNIFSTDRPI